VPSAKVRRCILRPAQKREIREGKTSEHPVSTTRYFTRHANVGALGYLVLAPSSTVPFVARRAASWWGCGLRTRVRKQQISFWRAFFPHSHSSRHTKYRAHSSIATAPSLTTPLVVRCTTSGRGFSCGTRACKPQPRRTTNNGFWKMEIYKCEYSFRFLPSVLIVKFRCSAHQHSRESDLREL